jgi:subtilase family serine protease
MRQLIRSVSCLASALLIASCGGNPPAVTPPSYASLPVTNVANPIDESRMVTLHGNVNPLARAEFDQGVVNPATRLDRMLLVLNSSPAQCADLDALLAAQQDPDSPLYHQWLTPAEFGARFGASDTDLAQVSAWLELHGLTVDEIPAGRRLVVFSGSVAQVSVTFRTGLDIYRVNGALHLANASDPQIPAALSGLVAGVVSLHDFRRTSEMRTRTPFVAQPDYSAGATHYLFPADFATIYDLNPLFAAGTNGTGSSIAIAARSNIRLSDVEAFRSIAGLAANDPTVTLDGADPGLVDHDQDESTLDAEWSGAVAPAASVNLVVAATTATTDGVDLAAAWIVNHAAAPVVSLSYGSCEQEMGATELAFYNSLWEQAASQGMSVFVASGDVGAAGCSAATNTLGTQGAVNGLCTSPYSTCVGGTEFNEGSDAAQYWSASNSSGYGSALAYIPEEVWNESASNGGTGLWASGGGASVVYSQPPGNRTWTAQPRPTGSEPSPTSRSRPPIMMAISWWRTDRSGLLREPRHQPRRLPASWRWWPKVSTALRKATPIPGCMLWRIQRAIPSTRRHPAITLCPASRVSVPLARRTTLPPALDRSTPHCW